MAEDGPAPTTTGDRIKALSKGLRVLRVLNEHFELSVLELNRLTAIPRPTIHRLINTLIADGYVAAVADTGRYRTTVRVQALSGGYREEAWITDIASPILKALQHDLVWPSDVATYEKGAMVIRQTTHDRSPVSVVGERIGSRIPLLASGLGRAFLAFCEPQVQATILEIQSSFQRHDHQLKRDPQGIRQMLDQIRLDGYAERVGGLVPRTFAIAVPILQDGFSVAALNIMCFSKAVSLLDARRDVLPKLKTAAADIEFQLAARAPNTLSPS